MSTFSVPLDVEVEDLRGTRVHALTSTVGERAAALRYNLDRVDWNHCDGLATEETDDLDPETPVEIKSVAVRHHDGTGRINVYPATHERLVEEGGSYAIVVYADVDHGGRRRIVALAIGLVDAVDVSKHLPSDPSGYQKVRWDLLVDEDVDVERWSA